MATVIEDVEAEFFHANGYLIVRNVLTLEELSRVQSAMMELTEYGSSEARDDPDFINAKGHLTGRAILKRVEYVIDKKDECKVLLGNPFILRSVDKLMGSDFIPTWDSMVLKLPGEGIIVPWHRDAGTGCVGDKPIFNVDFYLDRADEDTCVWVIPGSNLWSEGETNSWLKEHAQLHKTKEDFKASGAVPALMEPGDVLFHNILVLHGSPSNVSHNLRRVLYYEFRNAHVEAELGPHIPEYIPLKQKVLLACLKRRANANYIPADEIPFDYLPPAPFNRTTLSPVENLTNYRYAHGQYFRK